MLKTILTSGPVLGLLAAALMSAIAFGVRKLILVMASHPKLMPLEPLAQDLGTALDDGAKSAEADLKAGKAPATVALDAGKVVLADLKTDLPDAEKALTSEINVLINGVPTTAVTPGGATVSLPSAKPGQKGVIPLLVAGLIVLGVAIVGGAVALVATGNASQEISCIEQDINSNPAGLGSLVSGLSSNVESDIESALQLLGPGLAKCTLVELWDDTKAQLARNAALKANATLVAPAQTIKTNAVVAALKRGWSPVKGTTGGTSSSVGSTGGSTSGAATSTSGR